MTLLQLACIIRLSAVALLVLLSRAARTRLVAADFCARAHGPRGFSLRRTRLVLQLTLLSLLLEFHFTRESRKMRWLAGARGGAGHGGSGARRLMTRRLRPGLSRMRRLLALLNLNVEEVAHRFVVDARHHVLEEHERFLLELHQRVFLRVAAQPDALFQVVQREQVVFPLRINHVENNAALQPAHQVRAKLLFFFLVTPGDGSNRGAGKLVVGKRRGIGARSLDVDAELRVGLGEELRDVPLIGMLLARTEGFDQLAHNVFRDAQNVIALVLAFERGPADRVDRLALLVHHVVVFEKVFAGIEVLRFDGFLRVLDAARDELRFDGHAFGHAQAVHQRLDALATEDAHQIVFEREKKARGAGIALAAGASTQLVIDAPRLMAFRAEDVQSAERDHFVVLRFALPGKLVVYRLPLDRKSTRLNSSH